MRTKVTLILIFLNVALFGFIFYVRPKFDIEEKIKATRTRVLGPESADIQSLTLVAGPQTTALARRVKPGRSPPPLTGPPIPTLSAASSRSSNSSNTRPASSSPTSPKPA
ncbi:MAG TPA: hypothetical protein PLE80_09045 [Opitutaceae bacterium]|nr:hypothetical protein [Opitutaceae bacterium]